MAGWHIEPKSDQLNGDDLLLNDMILKFVDVKETDSEQQPLAIYYEGGKRPWKPCKTMRRLLAHVFKAATPRDIIGQSVRVYRDPTVRYGADDVGGIRIKEASIPAEITVVLTAKRGSKKAITVKPLTNAPSTSEVAPELIEAGNQAAKQGVEIYTRWKDSLKPEVKETIKPYHPRWAKVAKEADEKKAVEIAQQNGSAEIGIEEDLI